MMDLDTPTKMEKTEGSPGAASRARRTLRILSLMLASTAVTLALVEFLFVRTILGLHPDISTGDVIAYDPMLGWRFRPGANGWHRELDFAVHVRINSQGLRDVEHRYEKPPGVFRILAVGDSFTDGYGVETEQSYPRLMETLLRARMKQPVEVINLGLRGSSSDQQFLYLQSEGLKYHPDLVLVAFVRGDEDNTPTIGWVYGKPYFELENGKLALRGTPVPLLKKGEGPGTWRRLLSHSATFALAREAKMRLPHRGATGGQEKLSPVDLKISGIRLPSFGEAPWPVMTEIFREMKTVTEQSGARLALALAVGGPEYSRHLTTISQTVGIPFYDLAGSPEFRRLATNENLFFHFDAHWNPRGHQRVAELLADFVLHDISEAQASGTQNVPARKARTSH